jgi:hypothetical protein
MGGLLVNTVARRLSGSSRAIWRVVVPPSRMMSCPSSGRAAAFRAISSFFAFGVLFAFAEGEGQGGFGQAPAVDFRQQAGVGQFLEVPPDGVFRNPQFVAQVGGEYFLGLLQFLQDRFETFFLSICAFASYFPQIYPKICLFLRF